RLAVMRGEDDVGVADVYRQKHRSVSSENGSQMNTDFTDQKSNANFRLLSSCPGMNFGSDRSSSLKRAP
ncbi:MAG TPA: hypothetical protein PLG06_10115, partial [Anaerolineae bacterium]|nr:hypothetical protein [Anaerolineae bacterium]